MRKMTRVLASLLAVAMLFGCGGSGGSSSGGSTGGTEPQDKLLRVAIGEEGDGFDPAIASDSVSNNIIAHMFEGMFAFEGDKLVNAMCDSYTVSEDGITYTFKLKADAKWSDGTAVTATDFVNGIMRSLNPELRGLYANFIYEYVVGALDYYEGKGAAEAVGVKALDATTLEIKLMAPCPYLPQLMSNGVYRPVHPSVATAADSRWAKDPATCITNGAFKLESYAAADKVVLVKNENYYDAASVKLDHLSYKFMPDLQAQVAAFKTGEVDAAQSVPTDINVQYKDSPELNQVQMVVNYYAVMRDGTEAVKDARVRKALAMAINREELVQILGGGERPLYGLVPFGIQNSATGKDFREEGGALFTENVEEAKKLLAEAGYPNGEGFPELTYIYNENQRHSDTAQAIQAMWKNNLGIDIKLQAVEFKVLLDDRKNGNFQMARHAMSADYADPYAYLGMYVTGNIQNESQFSDAKYDALVAQANAEMDVAKRMELLHQAEAVLIAEEMRMIPLYTYPMPILVKETITGFTSSPAGHVNYIKADIA